MAQLVVAERDKPVVEAEGDIEKSAVTAEYYARQGPGSSPTRARTGSLPER
ncbi:hypothetical protein [Streptomyces sp. NPDC001536]|uniref:hypothetical protein n=1 Tax=Streptomyces sp. NPDC001536 TaxID=3364583 RepID=UPI003697BBBB